MQMEVFFLLKKRISLVSTAIAMNWLTYYELHDLEWTILLAESDLFVFIHLDTQLEPPMIYFIARLVV